MARRRAGSAAGELPPRGVREECMKGPRRARMPVYGPGSKRLGRTEKETEWLPFHAPHTPGNSHCAPTRVVKNVACMLRHTLFRDGR